MACTVYLHLASLQGTICFFFVFFVFLRVFGDCLLLSFYIIIPSPVGDTHLLHQMNVQGHKGSNLSLKGERAILIGLTVLRCYTAQVCCRAVANIVLKLLLLMRSLLLKNELCHNVNKGLFSVPIFASF